MSTTTAPKRSNNAPVNQLDAFFKISERGSSIGQEIRGGFVTFFAMAYILVLNPIILSNALPEGSEISVPAIAAGTALIAGIMTILMGVVANFPLALAAGMGLNAMVAFTLVLGSGLTYQEAMGLIFWEGILITVLVLTGFREAVFNAVPEQLKIAISVGIGLFIALIGLVNAGIVRKTGGPGAAPPVELGIGGSLNGWPAVVFLIGLFVTIVLYVKKVRGAILIGILSATVVGFIVELTTDLGIYNPFNAEDPNPTGWGLTVPELHTSPISAPDFATLGAVDFFGAFNKLGVLAVILMIFTLMLADFFDTMGTMVAVAHEGNLIGKDGNPPRSRQILLIDSLSAVAGGLGGVSSNTSYVESSAGVGEGARTGLASVVTGVLFLLSIFLAPVVSLVPSEAASTALVFVGFLMMVQVADIDWKDATIAIPAFFTIAFMPFTYNITVGIGAGFIMYIVTMAARGKAQKIHPLMWLVGALFVVFFALGPIQALLPDGSMM